MRTGLFILVSIILLHASLAHAGTAEARETARLNNCTPKKIAIYQQSLGNNARTIYRVDCVEPKTVGENITKTPSAILVECDASICRMLRAVADQQK